MQLLRQGDERTNDRYGKSAQPLRQHARQAHINVSDLVIGEAVSTYADRKGDQIWTKLQGQPFGILLMYMERETGIEPATFSLGKWLQIENKEHSEFRHLFQAIEFTGNSQVFTTRLLMEFKWSSLAAELRICSSLAAMSRPHSIYQSYPPQGGVMVSVLSCHIQAKPIMPVHEETPSPVLVRQVHSNREATGSAVASQQDCLTPQLLIAMSESPQPSQRHVLLQASSKTDAQGRDGHSGRRVHTGHLLLAGGMRGATARTRSQSVPSGGDLPSNFGSWLHSDESFNLTEPFLVASV